MPKTYVTFGQAHRHTIAGVTFDKDCVASIEVPDEDAGRRKAFELFGPKFCFEYHEEQFDRESLQYFPRGVIEVPQVTLLVIVPGKNSGEGAYHLLVAETGEGLAQHWCSDAGFAYGDLYGNRKSRQEKWEERFGPVLVKFYDDTAISLDTLIERNHRWAASQDEEE